MLVQAQVKRGRYWNLLNGMWILTIEYLDCEQTMNERKPSTCKRSHDKLFFYFKEPDWNFILFKNRILIFLFISVKDLNITNANFINIKSSYYNRGFGDLENFSAMRLFNHGSNHTIVRTRWYSNFKDKKSCRFRFGIVTSQVHEDEDLLECLKAGIKSLNNLRTNDLMEHTTIHTQRIN